MTKTRLTFMGSGTSQGVPVIGCNCPVCKSTDPKDKRFRSSVLVEHEGMTILVDAGPDFRSQMLREGVTHLDAILLTHNHKDHTGGLDDVRALNYTEGYPGVPEWHIHNIENQPFEVIVDDNAPRLQWVSNEGYKEIPLPGGPHLRSTRIIPIRGFHAALPVLGFRFGDIAYCTDMNYIPEEEFSKLEGLEHFIINTVKRGTHNSHWGLEQALQVCEKVGARHSWLTHLSDRLPRYADFVKELSGSSVLPAYDGLVIEA